MSKVKDKLVCNFLNTTVVRHKFKADCKQLIYHSQANRKATHNKLRYANSRASLALQRKIGSNLQLILLSIILLLLQATCNR